jgi:uncharacterized protein (TIGR03435 family)
MRLGMLTNLAAIIVAGGHISASISMAQRPKQFEVASIKQTNPRLGVDSPSSTSQTGSHFQMLNMSLKQWVEMGLSVRDDTLVAPSWLDRSRFDLNAKLPADTPSDRDASAEMMRSLLIERFGLKWHEEIRNVSGYELVPDKKVLVKPSGLRERLTGHGSGSGPTSIDGLNMSMSELASALAKALRRPVVDATHLSGGFDFRLTWRPLDDATAAEQKRHGIDVDNLPSSVFAAVREQLGLRLQNAKVPSKVIVVDHIDPQPTEN